MASKKNIGAVLTLRDNFSATLKGVRKEQNAFRKDVQETRKALEKAFKKKQDIRINNSSAMKAIKATRKAIDPLRKAVVVGLAYKDMVTARLRKTKNELKNIGRMVISPVVRVKNLIGGGLSRITSLIRSPIGLLTGYVGFTSIKQYASEAIEAAKNSQNAYAQLDAVLKSTNGAAGMTKTSIKKLTEQVNMNTIMSKGSIIQGENLLLTFTKIGKKVFPETTQTMMDMSQALKQDTTKSAMQLGKALNDPTRGMTALRRVGVAFTAQQEKQIKKMQKENNILGAQKVILAELKKEFGGSAKAQTQTESGRTILVEKQMQSLKTQIGNALMPFRRDFFSFILQSMPFIKSGFNEIIKELNSGYAYIKSRYLDNKQFQKMSFQGKVQFVFNDIEVGLNKWLDGGGRQKLQKYGQTVGNIIGTGLKTAAPGIASGAFEIGKSLASGVINGTDSLLRSHPIVATLLAAGLGFGVAGPGGALVAGGAELVSLIPRTSTPAMPKQAGVDVRNGKILKPKKVPNIKKSGYDSLEANRGSMIGHNANGTNYWRGGWTWTGEKGPELVKLPQGSQVTPNNKVSSVVNNNKTPVIVNIYAQDKTVHQIANELVPIIQMRLANM